MDTAVSMSDEGKGLGEEGGDKKQQPTERWSITGGFKVLSTYFHRPSPASSSLSFARLVSPGAAVRELRLARGLLASLAPVVDCLYELPSICVFHGGDRYDCDRGESGGTLIQQRIDRPIQNPPRLLSARPDRINAIRVFSRGHVRLRRHNPLIIFLRRNSVGSPAFNASSAPKSWRKSAAQVFTAACTLDGATYDLGTGLSGYTVGRNFRITCQFPLKMYAPRDACSEVALGFTRVLTAMVAVSLTPITQIGT